MSEMAIFRQLRAPKWQHTTLVLRSKGVLIYGVLRIRWRGRDMHKTICGAVVLIVTLSSALPMRCQSCENKVPAPGMEPARRTSISYSVEIRTTTVQTKADGSMDTQQESDLTAHDLQRRSLFAAFSADGSGRFSVIDPAAGTRTLWSSDNGQARVLTFPTAVPGRESCWRIPMEDQHVERGEQQFGIVSVNCPPAEKHQPPYCQVNGNDAEPPHDDSPQAKPSYEDCLRALASVIISGKISEKDEDLGVQTILGIEAHGCRSTIAVPRGTHMREWWWAEIGTAKRHAGFTLRSVEELPGPGERTTRITREATNLTCGQPDVAMFHPPDGYAIKKVEMREVPCDQASNPSSHAIDSH
jgi:hypothetical protein